jgi:hypothetical protein
VGFCWQSFEGDASNVILAPDSLANVKRSEVVQAKFEPVRQLLGFERKLDANTSAGEIVNSTMVNGRVVNRDLCRVISFGALRSAIIHLMVPIC